MNTGGGDDNLSINVEAGSSAIGLKGSSIDAGSGDDSIELAALADGVRGYSYSNTGSYSRSGSYSYSNSGEYDYSRSYGYSYGCWGGRDRSYSYSRS